MTLAITLMMKVRWVTNGTQYTCMKNDPGLLTDSTGEGMAGAEDVRLDTQRDLEKTYYNGSKPCIECGTMLNPVQ